MVLPNGMEVSLNNMLYRVDNYDFDYYLMGFNYQRFGIKETFGFYFSYMIQY